MWCSNDHIDAKYKDIFNTFYISVDPLHTFKLPDREHDTLLTKCGSYEKCSTV